MQNADGSVGQTSPTTQAQPRPSLVTFAGVMLMVMAGFSMVWAIVAFVQPKWLLDAYSAYGLSTQGAGAWVWGVLDLLLGVIALFTGIGVLRGVRFAQVIGFYIAGISAIRWFFFLSVVPVAAAVVIAIDVLVIYSLAARSKYFGVDASDTYDTIPGLGVTRQDPIM
jgi:hypothetical protein